MTRPLFSPLAQPPLTQEEAFILLEKGTERPFSSALVEENRPGVYYCRQCGTALFTSEHKFSCSCGWPAFDGCVPEAVCEQPDSDGERTEIVCAACHGHLGHVFRGEGLTKANLRHCVNALALSFIPTGRLV